MSAAFGSTSHLPEDCAGDRPGVGVEDWNLAFWRKNAGNAIDDKTILRGMISK
jgi:hypothetical protein